MNKPHSGKSTRRSGASGLLWLAVVAALLFGGVVWYREFNRPHLEVFEAQRGRVIAAVYGTVVVEYDYTRALRAENGGYVEFAEGISSGRISEGRPIQRGEILARVADEVTENAIRRNRIQWDAAIERQQLGAPSQELLDTALDREERLERLARTTRTVPAAELTQARNEVARLKLTVERERIELERELQTLQQEFEQLERDAARNVIMSPIDGIIKSVNVSDGDLVTSNSTIFEVAREGLHVIGEINEEDIGLLATGMPASIKLYSFPVEEFRGELTRVLPTGDNQRYSVIVSLKEPPVNLKSGMTGEMNVIIGERENAVYVPTRSVEIDRVLMIDDGIVRQRQVEIGFRNLEYTEILQGLEAGDLVVVEDQDLFRPGDRVRTSVMNQRKAQRQDS